MSTVDIQNTVTLLNDLSKNSGHFIIDCGPYYVQLAKEAESPNICFEAVSHNYNHLVPKTIQPKLEEYGFDLIKGKNYTKLIIINSNKDALAIALEISDIFNDIYQIEEVSMQFDDQIERSAVARNPNGEEQTIRILTKTTTSTPRKSITPSTFIILLLSFVLIYFFSTTNDKNKSSEIVINSSWDASVSQVENYLKENLNDPGSYDPISWSSVVRLEESNEKDNASYKVRHKYRAKNSFGGYVIKEQVFRLDIEGNVLSYRDFSDYFYK